MTHDEQPTATAPGAPRRTVPLTRRHVIDQPARPRPDPEAPEQDGDAWLRRERRHAGRLLWALILLAAVVQVVGLLPLDDFRVLAGAMVLAPYPALLLTVGVFTPRPPTGFFRKAPAVSSSSSQGLDSLFFASIAAAVVPQQVIIAWTSSSATGVPTSLGTVPATFGLGVVLLVAAVGLRERHHRKGERRPSARASQRPAAASPRGRRDDGTDASDCREHEYDGAEGGDDEPAHGQGP